MKKMVLSVLIALLSFGFSTTAFAGDIPESLIWNDEAQIFFGEVIDYHPDKKEPSISVSPVKKIKGDINIGSYRFGAEQWRTCYKIYAIVMVGLFVVSFFVRKGKGEKK